MDFNQLAILLGCALAIYGAVQIMRHDDTLRLLRQRGISIRDVLQNPDIRIVIIGVVIAVVGWLAD